MDPSLQAEAVLNDGRGAIAVAIFAAAWMYWGLFIARALTLPRVIAIAVVALALLAGAAYFIRKGKELRAQYPPLPKKITRGAGKWYLIAVIVEVALAIVAGGTAASLHRFELIPDWIAIVVGLHFLPLAKIFRAISMVYIGTAMVLWSIACWIFFHSNALGTAAALGTGALLWIACIASMARARTAARLLASASAPAASGACGQ
jgi:hypothetical protein